MKRFDGYAIRVTLEERIEDCSETRMLLVGAEQLSVADFAGRKPDGCARNGRFAQIESIAAAADAAANHDQTRFRSANGRNVGLVGKCFPGSHQFLRRRARQEPHAFLARHVRRTFLFQLRIHHFHLKCLLI
ncbi:hypothetical protein D9M68_922590 [compost metagenome]